ncbi:hypothetical protein MUP32_02570, partial [Candidatus Microgenomates bacterium]|nr:hypothetical protein [Candidatus Microgenomates bacterium]
MQEGGALLSLPGTTVAYLYCYSASGGACYMSWYIGPGQTGYNLLTVQGQGETTVVGGITAGIKSGEALQIGPTTGPIYLRWTSDRGWEYAIP